MTQSPVTSYNLVTQPWIPVRYLDGSAGHVSIRDALSDSARIAAIGGDMPTQAFALQRLLLAVFRRAVPWGRHPIVVWGDLWADGRPPVDAIVTYLDHFADRFDLLHPETPFYQVADFVTAKDAVKGVGLLIADRPSGHKYFTTRAGAGAETLSYAEAARWVVHCQAFDVSGIKTGDIRDARTKGGRGYPMGIAWAGQLGGVVFEGETFFRTLLLNTVLREPAFPQRWEQDGPVWERAHLGVTPRSEAQPLGPTDVLTWQSRRIRLRHDGSCVIGVVVGNGDPLTPQNRMPVEYMTAWRFSKEQSKKLGDTCYMPRTLDPDRALWRSLDALLADKPDADGRRAATLAPGVAHWIEWLVGEGHIDGTVGVRPRTAGLEYINNVSVIGSAVDDVLGIDVAMVGRTSQKRLYAHRAVEMADGAVRALADLAGNLAHAAGGDADGPRGAARARGFFTFDTRFRRWVAGLSDEAELENRLVAWQVDVRTVVVGIGEELIASAGEPAWRGRLVRDRWLDTSLASRTFWSALRKVIPDAFAHDPERTTDGIDGLRAH